jgi:hypothetical protein
LSSDAPVFFLFTHPSLLFFLAVVMAVCGGCHICNLVMNSRER